MKTNNMLALKMMASLGCITIVAAALMAWVNNMTAPRIAAAETVARTEAVSGVVPEAEFDNNPIEDAFEVNDDKYSAGPVIVYPLILNGRYEGAAVESYSLEGFDGEVRVMYGFDANGNVTGFRVMRQTETPGLGSRMEQWFADSVGQGNRSIIGLNGESTRFKVSKDGGDIDGITAATISSRAFLQALRRADKARAEYLSQHHEQ